jgi:hypothetical protein
MPDFSSSARIRVINESDTVRFILPRKMIPVSGPLKTLAWGIVMIAVPLLVASATANSRMTHLNQFRHILMTAGFPFEIIGVIFVLAAVLGLLPTHCEARLTPDLLIWVRWNGPLRFRRQWARAKITGVSLSGDGLKARVGLQLHGHFGETPDMGYGYPRELLSELAQELTQRGEFAKSPHHPAAH